MLSTGWRADTKGHWVVSGTASVGLVAVSILALSVQSKKTRGARKPTGVSCAIAMTSAVQASQRGNARVRMPANAPRS
jgi:hypothetical protein